MKVYDFDKTIYKGDSSVDFFIYEFLRGNISFKRIKSVFYHMVKYILGMEGKKEWKENFFSFLPDIDVDREMEAFSEKAVKRISIWYQRKKDSSDIIVTASPEFLVEAVIGRMIKVKVIGTLMRKEDGKIIGENCRGAAKRDRFLSEIKENKIDEFYSDSLSDAPMAMLSKRAYLVKHDRIKEWR